MYNFLGCRVDGYAVINDVETVWEYNGCSVHGCPCQKKKNLTDEKLEKQLKARQKWIERKAHLEANGCNVIEMTDCRWKKQLRYLRRNPPKTEYGRILSFDNQECFIFWTIVHFEQNGQVFILSILDYPNVKLFKNTVLKGIKDDEIFGFIRCDVTSPDAMINKHLKNGFLFPPIITKQVIEDEMLPPFMRELNEHSRSKEEASPVQTYHGTNLFLFTPLAKLYIELGMKISNVREVVQYYPGKCFLPFANRVVQLRSEATRDGDDAKQLTAKLFGNAGEFLTIFDHYVENVHVHIFSRTFCRTF